jgi:predicted PurR-regulated permease PerM
MQLKHDPQTTEAEAREYKVRALRVWTVIGGIVIFLAVVMALGYVASVIEFLAVGCILGFICSPIVNWLESKGMARGIGALLALLFVLVVAIGFFAILGPIVTDQLLGLLDRVPAFFKQGQEALRTFFESYGTAETTELQANISNVLDGLSTVGTKFATDLATSISSGIIPNVMSLFNVFFMFFLGIILAYWLARDYPTIVREMCVIAGPKHREDLVLLLAVTARSMGGYMKSIVITSIIDGLLVYFGFLLVGQPYAGLMAVITGLLHFLPVIGPWLSATLAFLTALFVSPVCAIWTVIVAAVAENVTDNLISPVVMRSTVQVHPAMSLLAIVVGSALGGAIGMTLAIPISAAIKGVFIYYFETKTGRQIVSYDGAIFQGTPYHYPDGSPAPSVDALDDDHFYDTSKLVQWQVGDDATPETDPDGKEVSFPAEIVAKVGDEAKTLLAHVTKKDDKDKADKPRKDKAEKVTAAGDVPADEGATDRSTPAAPSGNDGSDTAGR